MSTVNWRIPKRCEHQPEWHARSLHFYKYHGAGNDFILVPGEPRELPFERLCDRRFGIGADGVIFIRGGEAPRMWVVNADGSRPEMCGNGLRCAVRLLADLDDWKGAGDSNTATVMTDAGPHACSLVDDEVEVEMRSPTFTPSEIPIASESPWLDEPLRTSLGDVQATTVGMGNPHVVLFDSPSETEAFAKEIQSMDMFPEGVNVGFARVVSRTQIELRVYERGAGFTLACGTGACAAFAAAMHADRVDRDVQVVLPGGVLRVRSHQARLLMRGPAEKVFEGDL